MPLIIKPLILTSTVVIGASLALYETSPHIRAFVDSAASRLTDIFEEAFNALDRQLQLLSPEQREVRRRRQREHVRTAVGESVLFEASGRQQHNSHVESTELQSRPEDYSSTDQALVKASGVDNAASFARARLSSQERLAPNDTERKTKRRRLWELSESPSQTVPVYTDQHDSAMDMSIPTEPVAEESPRDVSSSHGGNHDQRTDSSTQLHDDKAATADTQDIVSDTSSISSYEAISTPGTDAADALQSPTPSIAPSDLVDELSSNDGRDLHQGGGRRNEEDNDDASTETMSVMSAYSFADYRSASGGEMEDLENADVISVASSAEMSEHWQSVNQE